jgi:hypothetical protein
MQRFVPILILAGFCLSTYAQTPSASVVGRVTDATAAVIPGVAVKVTNLDTNISQKVASNESGDYTVPYLNPGRYVLEASATGFRTYKRNEFSLAVDQILRINISLEVGAATESVTVSDTPPVLNTETATRGEVTTQEEIKEIPLDGRDFSDLALLTGGVIPKGDGGDGSYAVNGARADNAGFLLDGMNNTQRRNTGAMINPPIEGVQEFKMLTSGFSAEHGRYAGGMLTVVTKSGTNRLRGALYEFMRNDVFDATGYFDANKSKLRRNQFGSTVSGPVYLPKLYDGRNRTFFMFTWDSLRLTQGKSIRTVVPTPQMIGGDFSQTVDANGKLVVITDVLAKTPFPGAKIPANRLDKVAQNIAKYYPAPNFSAGVYNYISQGNSTNSFNNFGVKVDHNLSSNDRMTTSVFWRKSDSWDPVMTSRSPIPLFGSSNSPMDVLSYVRYLRTLTPTMYLEASANFSRKTNSQVWPYSADKDWSAETGFIGGTKNPVAAGPPAIEITSYMTLGPAYDIPKIWVYNNYQYAASTTWIRGRHSIKFGADFLRTQYFSRNYGDTRGRANFDGRFTGFSAADFVLGWANSTRRQLDASGPYHLLSSYSGYFQDDFKVTPSLTLNLGMRYEVMKPPKEKFGGWAMFLPTLGKVVVAGTGTLSQAEFTDRITSTGLAPYVVKASDVGLPATITKTDWTNFGPRFGFAWRVFGNTKTVLRGGYGIFYGQSSLYRMDEYADTFPFSITETFSRVSNNPTILTLSDPYPTVRRGFSGVTGSYGQENPEPQTQYIQSWNLTMERDFGGFVVEAAYAGSKGTHLQRRYDVNQQGREYTNRTVRPYPFFGSIQVINDGSNSIYNSGQLTVRRRFSKSLFVRGSYTYAKSLDESSNTGGTIQYNFSTAQDSRNLSLERGRSDFDIGHTFAGSFIWTPQFTRHWLTKDWQLSGTSTIYTGPPFTPRVANVSYANGEATRPDRIASGKIDNPGPDRWYDVKAFPVVPTGSYRFGNSGRNILDGPGAIIINLGLSRRFRFAESKSLQYRLETFNLPNHPNFSLPENNVNVLAAGTINRAKNNRNMQMGLRLEF